MFKYTHASAPNAPIESEPSSSTRGVCRQFVPSLFIGRPGSSTLGSSTLAWALQLGGIQTGAGQARDDVIHRVDGVGVVNVVGANRGSVDRPRLLAGQEVIK